MALVESWTGLTPLAALAAALMTCGAAFVRGLTGFGMAIILVPLLGMLIAPGQAVVVGLILQLLIGPVGLGIILREAHRASALPIGALPPCRGRRLCPFTCGNRLRRAKHGRR